MQFCSVPSICLGQLYVCASVAYGGAAANQIISLVDV